MCQVLLGHENIVVSETDMVPVLSNTSPNPLCGWLVLFILCCFILISFWEGNRLSRPMGSAPFCCLGLVSWLACSQVMKAACWGWRRKPCGLLLPWPHMSQKPVLGTLECSFSPCTQILVFTANLNSNNLPPPLHLKKKKKKEKKPCVLKVENKGQPRTLAGVCFIMCVFYVALLWVAFTLIRLMCNLGILIFCSHRISYLYVK